MDTNSSSSSSDLSNQIRSAILQDPRAQTLAPDQLNRLVGTLSQQAQKQGITPSQLSYHPGTPYMQPTAGYAVPPNYAPEAFLSAFVLVVAILAGVWYILHIRARRSVSMV